jgi:WD40 repeat protein
MKPWCRSPKETAIVLRVLTLCSVCWSVAILGSRADEQPPQGGGPAAAEASPFDRLDRAAIPEARRVPKAPPELVAVLDARSSCQVIVASPNGKFLAWSLGKKVLVHDLVAGRTVGDLEGGLQATSLAFSPDGKTLAAACLTIPLFDAKGDDLYRPGLVRLWDMTKSPPEPLAPLEHVSTKAGFRAVGGEKDSFRGFGINPIVVAFAPDSKSLAVGTFGTGRGDVENLWLWDLTKKPPRPRMLGDAHWRRVEALAFAPDGKSLASGGFDGTIRVWDLTRDPPRPGPEIQATDTKTKRGGPISGEANAVMTLAFSPDGSMLAGSGTEGVVRLWDATKAAPPAPIRLDGADFRLSNDLIRSAFSLDGRLIAAAGRDQTCRLIVWDVAEKKPRMSCDLPGGELGGHVAWAPDGRHLVVGTDRGIYVFRIRAASPKK